MGKEYTIYKKQEFKHLMKSTAKERKESLKEKRSRLIVKNLPFQVTEEKLRTHFEQFGKVTSVQLLKREDGNLVGCGFVQFDAVQKAAKAKHHLHGKPFLGRDIQCDFVMPKTKFERKVKKEARKFAAHEVKDELIDVDDVQIKDEPIDVDNDVEFVKTEIKEETGSEDEDEEAENSSDDDENDSGSEDKHTVDEEIKQEMPANKTKYESHDVNEGKTIFIKNLPFEVTNDDLKQCMSQFGRIYYALVCMDKLTEHSKGTGFVKFHNKEDAAKCLQAGTELKLFDTILDVHPAIDRNEIGSEAMAKKRAVKKDSRNLYLVKEGVILAGSKAAENVSARDMAKRLQLEQFKSQMLRNLNMFVSKTRLVIQNLPATWNDNKLRMLVKKYAGSGAVIKEARVMRNLMKVDGKGVGESKEYGFISFTTHEHALRTLRSLNNNPNVFTEAKRPIVAFSIENRVMINKRMKRLENSRQLNPISKDYDPQLRAKYLENRKNRQQVQSHSTEGKQVKGNLKDLRERIKQRKGKELNFAGIEGTPGAIQKMRSKYKLKMQAQTHHEQLKAERKRKKNMQKPLSQRKQSFLRQEQQKINKKKQSHQFMDDNFAKIVNNYKSKLMSAKMMNPGGSLRGKWTDG